MAEVKALQVEQEVEQKKGKVRPPRFYYFALNLYPSEEKHAEFVKQKLKVYPHIWYGILHDKDTYEEDGVHNEKQPDGTYKEVEYKKGDLKKPHWHIVIKLKQNMTEKAFKDNMLFWGIESNYIQSCDGVNMSMYLDHRTHPHKHQYNPREIFGDTQYYYNIVSQKEDTNTLAQLIVALTEYHQALQDQCNKGQYAYQIKYTSTVEYLCANNYTHCLQTFINTRYLQEWIRENGTVVPYNPYENTKDQYIYIEKNESEVF